MKYWEECIRIAFDDAKIEATEEQILEVVDTVEDGHENYGMMHGTGCIPNPLLQEIEVLRKEVEKHRTKTTCPECKGSGREVCHGPIHSSESDCFKCRGEGFLYY